MKSRRAILCRALPLVGEFRPRHGAAPAEGRITLLEMAQAWDRLADEQDRASDLGLQEIAAKRRNPGRRNPATGVRFGFAFTFLTQLAISVFSNSAIVKFRYCVMSASHQREAPSLSVKISGGGGAWRARKPLDPRLAGGKVLPGGPGRHARSRGGIDCPAAFIHDAVGRH